jgi:DNA repair ATPase RecN
MATKIATKKASTKTNARAAKKVATKRQSAVPSHINALLHTMRSMAQYEDRLCSLMHEITSAKQLSEEARSELTEMLEEMPYRDYLDDLHALREELERRPGR